MENLNIVMKHELKYDRKSIVNFVSLFSKQRDYTLKNIDLDADIAYYVWLKKDNLICISIFFDEDEYCPNTLMISLDYKILFKSEKTELKKIISSFIQDAIALMQISNNQYFVGGREVFETGPGESRYTIFFFKGNEHIKFLKKHLFEIFKLDLEEKEIKDYVEKYADINEDYPDDYHLICFYPYRSDNEPKNFYDQIEKLKND